jgi:hypothetical protein
MIEAPNHHKRGGALISVLGHEAKFYRVPHRRRIAAIYDARAYCSEYPEILIAGR